MKQIFRKLIPPKVLFELLEKVCLKTEKYYFIDLNAFKKILFHKYHIEFIEKIRGCYYLSKQFYVDRKFTYNSCVNIIRQICKSNEITFTSEIKYNESKYNIDYFVYYNGIEPGEDIVYPLQTTEQNLISDENEGEAEAEAEPEDDNETDDTISQKQT